MSVFRLPNCPVTDVKVGLNNVDREYVGLVPVWDRSLAVLDKQWRDDTATGSAAALTAYTTGVNEQEPNSSLTPWSQKTTSAWAVSANRLRPVGTAADKHAYRQFDNGPIGTTEKFHISMQIDWKGTYRADFRLSAAAIPPDSNASIGLTDTYAVGLSVTSTGNLQAALGGTIAGALTVYDQDTWGSGGLTAQPLYVDIDSDGVWDSFTITTADNSSGATFKTSRAQLTAAGGQWKWYGTYLVGETRGASGTTLSHVNVVRGSLQPHRAPTLSGTTLDGSHHRVISTRGTDGSLRWTIIPKTYNPSAPVELVGHYHGAQSGNRLSFWNRTASKQFYMDILNAGHIVYSSADGAASTGTTTDRWGNSLSRLESKEYLLWLRAFATAGHIPIGESMGMMAVVSWMLDRQIGSPTAIYAICPGYTVVAGALDARYQAPIRAAYGNATTQQQVIDRATPYDGAGRPPDQQFRLVPVRWTVGQDDPDRGNQGDAQQALAANSGWMPEASRRVATGGHLEIGSYDSADFLAFRNRARAFYATAA